MDEEEVDDTLIIQIKRPSVKRFKQSLGLVKTSSSSLKSLESAPLITDSFVMESEERGKKSYEAMKLIKPPTPIEEKSTKVAGIKVGSWRTEVMAKDSFLTRRSSEGSKLEMIRCILNDLIVNIKPEEGMQGSISSFHNIQMYDNMRLERMQKQHERQVKGRISSTRIVRTDQYLSNGPRLSVVVKEYRLPTTIDKIGHAEETDIQLDTVSLSSASDTLRKPVSKVALQPELKTGVSGVALKEGLKPSLQSTFALKWCFGFESDVPVVNLSANGDRFHILFANNHFSVLFDFHKQTMHFLPGHHNCVASIATDSVGSLMVTADSGPGSRVIVWDSRPCAVKVLEDVHPCGTRLVGLSAHSEYLVTVSPSPEQTVQLWNYHHELPAAVKSFSGNLGEIKKLSMNKNCIEEFALISDAGVTFVYYEKDIEKEDDKGQLIFDSHQSPFKLGTVTGATFLTGDDDAAALTSTSKGYVILWAEEEGQHKKVYKKHVHLHFESIKHIEVVDGLVALATVSGNVSFYDLKLKIVFWIKLQMGDLKSISFNLTPQVSDSEVLTSNSETGRTRSLRSRVKVLVDATLQNNPISIRHFVVCSESGQLAYCDPTIGVPKNMFYSSPAAFTAISIHPSSHYFCAGTALGHCILVDTDDHEIKVTQKLNVADNLYQAVSCLTYSSSGFQLACGMHTGALWLLHPLFLTPVYRKPLTIGANSITHLLFSSDSNFLAVGDSGSVVTLYSMQGDPVLLGQYQAHSRPIADLLFVSHGSGVKLLSLGTDRVITEFQVNESTQEEAKGLMFKIAHRVEQTDIPRCILPYPIDENYFLMLNSDLKFKLLDVETLKCCKTLQAPNFGYPIKYLEPLSSEHYKQYLLFCSEKHVGIHKLPVDGNPYRAMAHQVSPTSIVCCKVHKSGKYVYVVSEGSKSIDMWEVNTDPLEEQYKSGGEGMEPFWNMLEGGKGGWRERDIREFFTVGQFAHQGERPGVTRSATDILYVCEIASVFQALGFYPTKYQINNLMYEVTGYNPRNLMLHFKYRAITLEQFVLLYVNHRPSRQTSAKELQQAFLDLYNGTFFSVCDNDHFRRQTQPIFSADSFVEQLMNLGEESTYGELLTAFSILCDKDPEAVPSGVQQPIGLMGLIPKELSFKKFMHDILGLKCKLQTSYESDDAESLYTHEFRTTK